MKHSIFLFLLIFVLLACVSGCNDQPLELLLYHQQLTALRREFRPVEQPHVSFYLFGMGNRAKLCYKDGHLFDTQTGDILYTFAGAKATIIPNAYRVDLRSGGKTIAIYEDSTGVYVKDNSTKRLLPGTGSPVHLPDFQGHRYSEILKVLHHEILINIVDSKPLPNYFVYQKPWRRDAAMMAMCLKKTGNLELIRDWVLGLDDPYDHNNGSSRGAPENEADNLGQTLYLLSLFTDSSHPLVSKILDECKKYEVRDEHGLYIRGRSDFQEVPVYQTKWLKFGLDKMGLPDPYSIPMIPDNYSSLFWWDFEDKYVATEGWVNDKYPYIQWARDHFNHSKNGPVSNNDYPLTWETEASEADYNGMAVIDSVFTWSKTSAPHTWHAAEMFLYLLPE